MTRLELAKPFGTGFGDQPNTPTLAHPHILAPQVGIEPTNRRLTVGCPTLGPLGNKTTYCGTRIQYRVPAPYIRYLAITGMLHTVQVLQKIVFYSFIFGRAREVEPTSKSSVTSTLSRHHLDTLLVSHGSLTPPFV